ncbi:MAG TPA: ABC-F family ATP-binding cassette domain-containing protein [Anaerolineae bacterium]|nr:ABC-F family ATP-binding cassette domain-containing protein [Anaerolineae bacterium]
MSIVTAHHVRKSFGALDVLSDVTLALARGQRAALVGPNGAGKTTLLRILAGLEETSGGTVHRARGLAIGFLPQHAEAELTGDVSLYDTMRAVFAGLDARAAQLHELELAMAEPGEREAAMDKYSRLHAQFELDGGYTYETRIKQVLGGVGFGEEDYARPVNILSGGQMTRALLARLILQSPGLLLLDEPTNHLDVDAVEWLEATLDDYPGAIVIVAHDRYFLDAVVNTVWDLERGIVAEYPGNYSKYLALREERRERRVKEFQRQQECIAKEEEYIRRNMAGQNTRQAQGRLKRLNRLERLEQPRERKAMRLNLETDLRSGDIVLRARDLVVGYQDDRKPLVRCDELLLLRGQRAALWGPNGAGKTTFLRTVLGEVPPLAGEVSLGASVDVGYLTQAQEALDPDDSILGVILAVENMPISKARGLLGRYLFSGDDVFKRTGDLSGGERARVALAILALRGANVLLLDEPTNHLDLEAQDVLQDVLSDFAGTMILVSHDRYLVDALATHVWAIEGGALVTHEGNYTDYAAQRAAKARAQGRPARGGATRARAAKAAQDEERKRQKRVAELETEITVLETRIADLSHQIEKAPPDKVGPLGEEYTRVEQDLHRRLDEWAVISDQ